MRFFAYRLAKFYSNILQQLSKATRDFGSSNGLILFSGGS